ncbi:MAG TPA: hypothetical protein ENH23_01970 [candidate division Zixibacteria bacterium]|nr:hypothetical protein [candidate division Zixibacteria bacterium]
MKPLIIFIVCMLMPYVLLGSTNGYPALDLSIYDTEDPIGVGKQTLYVITIQNEGTSVATNVKIKLDLSPEIKFLKIKNVKGNPRDFLRTKPIVTDSYKLCLSQS